MCCENGGSSKVNLESLNFGHILNFLEYVTCINVLLRNLYDVIQLLRNSLVIHFNLCLSQELLLWRLFWLRVVVHLPSMYDCPATRLRDLIG